MAKSKQEPSTERTAAMEGPLSTNSIDLGAGDGGPEWGIFAHTLRRQPSAAERRKRTVYAISGC